MELGRRRADNRKAKILIFNGFWPFLGLYQTIKMVEAEATKQKQQAIGITYLNISLILRWCHRWYHMSRCPISISRYQN